ncbi:hypothetical protein I2F27_10575 [Acinetobacter sp. B5B]|uniref:hypothetical protein n=1 Tax=Acinetobacter baretiae TaxID=2605383 RepID=UPI0018C22509|nr:hypothetical protein [Acinetobacter baretiae]MBF7683760.1 hypothetical protein [Acinetobacter baretiae]MBF7686333.1 hypothetical protein [Acinetobacter baretiae]
MSFYHIIIEINDHISSIEETRDLEIFDIEDLTPYIHSIFLPYMHQQMIELEDENILCADILHLEIQHTHMPIAFLIEEEQKELPSDTQVTISAKEIFNDHELSKNITAVVFDLLNAVKIEL